MRSSGTGLSSSRGAVGVLLEAFQPSSRAYFLHVQVCRGPRSCPWVCFSLSHSLGQVVMKKLLEVNRGLTIQTAVERYAADATLHHVRG